MTYKHSWIYTLRNNIYLTLPIRVWTTLLNSRHTWRSSRVMSTFLSVPVSISDTHFFFCFSFVFLYERDTNHNVLFGSYVLSYIPYKWCNLWKRCYLTQRRKSVYPLKRESKRCKRYTRQYSCKMKVLSSFWCLTEKTKFVKRLQSLLMMKGILLKE